jgi:hypothetical protein
MTFIGDEMYERHTEPLASTHVFLIRLLSTFLIGLVIIIISLYAGMVGYHLFENMSWIDAFVNASMILSGMGPLTNLTTRAGKLFAGFYALYSGFAIIIIISIIFSPIIHRFFHKLHLDTEDLGSK